MRRPAQPRFHPRAVRSLCPSRDLRPAEWEAGACSSAGQSGCLLSSGSRVRILPGAPAIQPAQRMCSQVKVDHLFRPGRWSCYTRATGSRAGQLGADPGCDRLRQLALAGTGRVQVDQGSSAGRVAHALHQLARVCSALAISTFPACRKSWMWPPAGWSRSGRAARPGGRSCGDAAARRWG